MAQCACGVVERVGFFPETMVIWPMFPLHAMRLPWFWRPWRCAARAVGFLATAPAAAHGSSADPNRRAASRPRIFFTNG